MTGDTGENSEALKLALTPEEAARAIGVGRSTIYQLLMSGRLPSVRVGKRYLVPVAAIEAFLVAPDSDPAA